MYAPRNITFENIAIGALARNAFAVKDSQTIPTGETCLSCGRKLRRVGASIEIDCIEGRTVTVYVCPRCASERGMA